MSGTPTPRTAEATSAGVHTAVAVGAHVVAAGCLPNAGLLALPVAFVGVLLLGRLLADQPTLALATGQLTVHAALAAAAACAGQVGSHTSSVWAGPMTYAHVGAVVLCRVLVVRAVALLERAAAVTGRLVARLVRPFEPVVLPLLTARPAGGSPAPLTGRLRWGTAPVRGPPRAALPLPG